MSKSKPLSRSRFSLPAFENWPPALRFLLQPFSRRTRILLAISLTLFLFAISYLDITTGDRVDFKPIYGFIILIAFTLFRIQGIWWLLAVVVSYQSTIAIHRLHPSPHLEFLDDLIALASFGVIGLLITMIADGVQEVRRSQELLRRDLILAGQTQRQILPGPLNLPWVKAEGLLRPTGEVGGDFYILEPLRDDELFFAIGDVEGKGVSAALTMVRVTALTLEAVRETQDVSSIFERINRFLCLADCGIVTVFGGTLSGASGGTVRLRCAHAGHENAIRIKPNGQWEELGVQGLPFGVLPDEEYHEQSLVLEPFDALFLFTDGLVDTRDARMNEFGRERLAEAAALLAKQIGTKGIAGWLGSIFALVDAHRGDRVQEDDMAALGIQILPV